MTRVYAVVDTAALRGYFSHLLDVRKARALAAQEFDHAIDRVLTILDAMRDLDRQATGDAHALGVRHRPCDETVVAYFSSRFTGRVGIVGPRPAHPVGAAQHDDFANALAAALALRLLRGMRIVEDDLTFGKQRSLRPARRRDRHLGFSPGTHPSDHSKSGRSSPSH